MNELIKEISILIQTEIMEIITGSDEFFPSTGQRGKWNYQIVPLVNLYLENLSDNLSTAETEKIISIKDKLIQIVSAFSLVEKQYILDEYEDDLIALLG